MKRLLTFLMCGFFFVGMVQGEEGASDRSDSTLERGTEATAQGIKHGFEAAGNGIKRGAQATVHGIEVGISAAGRGIRRGVEATSHALKKVGEKISTSSSN